MTYQINGQIEEVLTGLEKALLSMDFCAARRCFEASGLLPHEFCEKALAPSLDSIGRRWETGELALAQIYMSGRISEKLVDTNLPSVPSPRSIHPPMAVSVLDDFHPLGKRILYSSFRAHGFNLIDFGPATVQELAGRVRAEEIRILLVSVLMLASALKVRDLRAELDRQGLEVFLMVGGAPFRLDPALYREVGADATSPTASGAVEAVRELVASGRWQI